MQVCTEDNFVSKELNVPKLCPKNLVVSELGGAGRAATRRASQRETRHLEIRALPKIYPEGF
jgi:hypothetical protein